MDKFMHSIIITFHLSTSTNPFSSMYEDQLSININPSNSKANRWSSTYIIKPLVGAILAEPFVGWRNEWNGQRIQRINEQATRKTRKHSLLSPFMRHCKNKICVYKRSSSSSGSGAAAAASSSAWYLAISLMSICASGGFNARASTNIKLLSPASFLASHTNGFSKL